MALVARDAQSVRAEVQCSSVCHVSLNPLAEDLSASCDCAHFRRAGVCKHVWAVVLRVEEEGVDTSAAKPTRSVGSAVPGPLATVTNGSPAEASAPSGSRPLFYLLRPNEGVVDLYQATAPRGIPKPLRIQRSDVKRLTDPLDRRLLSLLFGIDSGDLPEGFNAADAPYRVECSSFTVNDANCRSWIELLCETGRLRRVRDGAPAPVEWNSGPPWTLGLSFESDSNPEDLIVRGHVRRLGESRPIPETDGVLAGGVVIVDDVAYPLDLAGCETWLDRVRNGAWRGPRADLLPALRELVERADRPWVELPPSWKREDEARRPQPVLALRLAEGGRARRELIPGRLFFDYGDRRVGEHEPSRRICDVDREVIFVRDLAFEVESRRELLAAGVQIVEQPTGHFDYRVPASRFSVLASELLAAGWAVESKEQRFRGNGKLSLEVATGEDWFELEGKLEIGDEVVPLPKVLQALRKGERVVKLGDGTLGLLPEAWVRRVAMLTNMGDAEEDRVRFRESQGWIVNALLADRENVSFDAAFVALREKLASFDGIKPGFEPAGFRGELRVYQRQALGWFRFLREFGLGGCLADDMGLGKTVQVLAMLEELRTTPGPHGGALVVAPRSVVYNWIREAERFSPELRVLEYAGGDRDRLLGTLQDHDLIVTSYGVLRRDAHELTEHEFDYVILDEAQSVKNPNSKTAKCARLLRAKHRLALTGTPIENHIFDLWSLFEFLNPGMLGSSTAFQRLLEPAADGHADERATLASALRPFLLRRTKAQVATELPERTEQTLFCSMGPDQRAVYDELLGYYRASLLARVDRDGLASSKMHVLEALLRLRQAACDPRLIDPGSSESSSTKLDLLVPHLQEIVEEGHKALVFSQFTSFLALVRERLDRERLPYEYLDGRTRNREAHVDRFQNDPDCRVFLISLKAGGLGLNLTAAEYVFILDPWWNPAVEAQAIDRAHRIGQDRHVFAYRLICRDTVEEKILALQQKKKDLADALIRVENRLLETLTREDLELLLS